MSLTTAVLVGLSALLLLSASGLLALLVMKPFTPGGGGGAPRDPSSGTAVITAGGARRPVRDGDVGTIGHPWPPLPPASPLPRRCTAAELQAYLPGFAIIDTSVAEHLVKLRDRLRCSNRASESSSSNSSRGAAAVAAVAAWQTELDRCPPLVPVRAIRINEFQRTHDYSQYGQASTLDRMFGGKRGGFFVEAGANNGQTDSNSWLFEHQRGWKGLLVEPDRSLFRKLSERRTAVMLQGCLSSHERALHFNATASDGDLGLGHIVSDDKDDNDGRGQRQTASGAAVKRPPPGVPSKNLPREEIFPPQGRGASTTDGSRSWSAHRLAVVHCYRLTDVLLALGRTHVDFLSLDVEGHELEVLRGIDFNVTTIDVMLIEYMEPNGWSHPRNVANLRALDDFVLPRGYTRVGLLPNGCVWQRSCLDALYVRTGAAELLRAARAFVVPTVTSSSSPLPPAKPTALHRAGVKEAVARSRQRQAASGQVPPRRS